MVRKYYQIKIVNDLWVIKELDGWKFVEISRRKKLPIKNKRVVETLEAIKDDSNQDSNLELLIITLATELERGD